MTTLMKINELGCELNMPDAVPVRKDADGNEIPQVLPPYSKVDAHVVDEYPACPADWMHGSDQASSYFVGVQEDKGMWLDFNACRHHAHDVAVVISVQGINPISGRKLKGNKLCLEQYKKKCPKHGCKFRQDRFCPKCGFKWPSQNYLTTTVTPRGLLWLDGFRSGDGRVRQYIFSEEEIKSVAAQVFKREGDDPNERVFAIGVAFYLSKNPKPQPQPQPVPTSKAIFKTAMFSRGGSSCSSSSWSSSKAIWSSSNSNNGMTTPGAEGEEGAEGEDILKEVGEVQIEKKLEVAQGAEIDQRVYVDTHNLDYYDDKPFGLIYINYAMTEDVRKILSAGKRHEKKDGFLAGVERVIN